MQKKSISQQNELKPIRDYLQNPRTSTERDPDYRDDLGGFDESRTKQADAQSADINYIMARYEATGQLPTMIGAEPSYGDFSDVSSFQEALGIVAHAREQFNALDAKVRARFDNDPEKMLEFVNDPNNAKEMVELGLAVPRVQKESPEEILKGIRDNTKPVKTKDKPGSGVLSE